MNETKRLWYAVGVVAVLVVAVALSRSGAPTPTEEGSPSPSAMASPSATPQKTPGRASGGTTSVPASYGEAVTLYQGRRIQFGMYCEAVPSSTTFKTGTSIMLDNRSGDARTIRVGSVAYTLAGYGWRIITLSSKTLPVTLALDCGTARNVGTILLQK